MGVRPGRGGTQAFQHAPRRQHHPVVAQARVLPQGRHPRHLAGRVQARQGRRLETERLLELARIESVSLSRGQTQGAQGETLMQHPQPASWPPAPRQRQLHAARQLLQVRAGEVQHLQVAQRRPRPAEVQASALAGAHVQQGRGRTSPRQAVGKRDLLLLGRNSARHRVVPGSWWEFAQP